MKTTKQIETLEFAQAYVASETGRLGKLALTLARIMKGYEPLLGDAGPGNTHGDNLQIRAYAAFVAEQIISILYNPMMSDEDRHKWRIYLSETYLSDPEIVAWKDLLRGII
jgi:hypothetical protein